MYYVYAYLDTRKPGNFNYNGYHFDFEPFYIGKGSKSRYLEHLHESYDLKNDEHKHRKIRKIIAETGDAPLIVKVKEHLLENESIDLEKYLINIIGRKNLDLGSLINKTDGGEGLINPSDETKRKISESRKRWMSVSENKQKIFTEKRNKKISIALTGKKKSKEHVLKLPQNKKGYKHDEEFKNKISNSLMGNNRAFGMKHSEKTKCIISEKISGKNNPMYNKSVYYMWVEKYGKELADKKWKSLNEKRRKTQLGQKKSEEWRKKLSDAAKTRWAKTKTIILQ